MPARFGEPLDDGLTACQRPSVARAVASADELKKHGKLQKKILFVVTDGEDDASRESLEQAVRRLQEENGPTVYAIGLLSDERQRRARRALQTIAERTGGIAFFPRGLDEVDEISGTVAREPGGKSFILFSARSK